MRKRLIGKAFAVAMSGAMVFTASPVTANIFNVASIVKAAEADQAEEWTYCYVGLTWAEYWANEGVYAADNTNASTSEDARTDGPTEYDRGGYDVVTRATSNHGLHRGSFQCTSEIVDEDGNTYKIAYWTDKKEAVLVDGSKINFNGGTITVGEGDTATTHQMDEYKVLGLKYVPIKATKSVISDMKKAGYTIVENGSNLTGGCSEGELKSYTDLVANVDENTNGLKTVTEDNGKFTFSKRATGSTSGIANSELKTAEFDDSDTSKIVVAVRNPESGSTLATGHYGDFIRVDLTENFGDLGSNLQAAKWEYLGDGDTVLRTFGTKFAADNWMHNSRGIQLGLTDSYRCQLPEGKDGTGKWRITLYALGYKDTTFEVEITENDINKTTRSADNESVTAFKSTISDATKVYNDQASYCNDENWSNFVDSLDKAKYLVESATDQNPVLFKITTFSNSLAETLKNIHKHDIETITTPATTTSEGSIVEKCKNCGEVISTKTIEKLKDTTTAAPSTTTVTNKTQVKAPAKTTVKLSKAKKTSIKVSWKKVSGASVYQIQYSTSKNFKNAKTVKVSAKSASKVLKKLKKNKKYYVRVRSYKTVKVNNKNTNVYSAWSAKKALKTKKK